MARSEPSVRELEPVRLCNPTKKLHIPVLPVVVYIYARYASGHEPPEMSLLMAQPSGYQWTVAGNGISMIEEAWRPALLELAQQLPWVIISLLIPTFLLYLSIYMRMIAYPTISNILTFASIAAFYASPYVAPLNCSPVRCIENTASL